MPLSMFSTLCSFCTLAVFDERLFVCGSSLIGNLDGLGNLVPQLLRLTISLLLERTGLGVRRFGMRGIENELLLASRQILNEHLLVPVAAELEQILSTLGVLYMASNSVVCSSHPALDFEVNLSFQTQLRATDVGVVTELILHLAEQDTSGIHIGLCDEVSLVAVRHTHDCNALHETADRVAQESTAWFEGAVDTDVVLGGHEEVARLGRVVRSLLGNVVSTRVVGVVPVSSKGLAEDRVERLLDAWRLDVPSTKVELSHGDKALDGVVDVRQSEEDLRMSHKVCDSFEHGSWLENESRQCHSTQVSARSQLADDV